MEEYSFCMAGNIGKTKFLQDEDTKTLKSTTIERSFPTKQHLLFRFLIYFLACFVRPGGTGLSSLPAFSHPFLHKRLGYLIEVLNGSLRVGRIEVGSDLLTKIH